MAKKVDSKVTPIVITVGSLLQPTPGRSTDRKVWGIPLKGVLVPFLNGTHLSNATRKFVR